MAEVEEGLIDRLRESKRREQLELAAGEVCAWLKRNDLPRDNSTAELTAALIRANGGASGL